MENIVFAVVTIEYVEVNITVVVNITSTMVNKVCKMDVILYDVTKHLIRNGITSWLLQLTSVKITAHIVKVKEHRERYGYSIVII